MNVNKKQLDFILYLGKTDPFLFETIMMIDEYDFRELTDFRDLLKVALQLNEMIYDRFKEEMGFEYYDRR